MSESGIGTSHQNLAIDKNTKVRETIDLNIKGGNYGKPTEIKYL